MRGRPKCNAPREEYRGSWLLPFGREMIAVSRATGCWLWLGMQDKEGYGLILAHRDKDIRINETRWMIKAHRYFYDKYVRGLRRNEVIDHLCRNRLCVNPKHLDPTTDQENIRRGKAGRRTHCKRGHEKTDDNVRYSGRSYHCKKCDSLRREGKI